MSDDLDNGLDWLHDDDEDEELTSSDSDDLDLDWLRDSANDDGGAGGDTDDLEGLDWIQDESEPTDPLRDDGSQDIEGDWQLSDDEDEIEAEEAVPDWLADAAPVADDTEEAAPEWLAEAEDDVEEAVEEATPDWLDAVEVDAGETMEEAAPDWLDAVEDAAEIDDDEEVPEWLDGTGPLSDDDEEEAEEAVPDWLDAEEEPETVEEDLPDWLEDSEEDEEVPFEDEPLEELEPELSDTGALENLFEDTEDLFEEAVAEGESDLDGLFADLDEDAAEFEEEMPADLGDLFSEETFDQEDSPVGDLLSEMADGDDDLGDLLGEDDFDLLGELAGDDSEEPDEDDTFDLLGELAEDAEPVGPEDDTFDLLGELTDDEALEAEPDDEDVFELDLFGAIGEETEPQPEPYVFPDEQPVEEEDIVPEPDPVSAATDEALDLLDEMLDEEEADEAVEDALAGIGDLLSDTVSESTKDTAVLDEDLVSDMVSEAEADQIFEEAEDEFAWFDEVDEEEVVEEAPSVEDAEWLEAVEDEGEAEETLTPEFAAVDDFLASLDEGEGFATLPQTGELVGEDEDAVEVGDVFEDDVLEDIEEDEGIETEGPPIELAPDAPEWMTDLAREEVADEHSAAALARQQEERPLEELSDQLLALRDRGLSLPTTQEETGMTEVESVVADLPETLPPIALQATEASFARDVGLTDEQRAHAEMLREVVGSRGLDEEESTAVPVVRRRRARLRLEQFVIAAVLIVFMALPFFTDVAFVGNKPPTRFDAASRQQVFFDQVDALQPEQMVLIAAEYGPTGAGELDPATAAVIRHALVRQAYPVIVGGNPVGLLHVNNIIEELTETNEESNLLVRNQHYTVGRYLVADAIGLRQFAESVDRSGIVEYDLWGDETGLEIQSLDDFALIVVIAETPERLRTWAEQVAPNSNTPILVVTGHSAAPLSEPFVDADENIIGMLIGYEDAFTYNTRLDIMLGLREEATNTPTITPTSTPTETPTITPMPTDTDIPTEVPAQDADDTAIPDGQPTEEPTPTREILPTDTPVPPTDTPAPTDTPIPTDTPTATNTPTPTDPPTPTSTPEPVLFAIVTADGAINVRGGPDTTFDIVGTADPGERLLIIDENEDASWYNVLLPDSTPGWVAAFLIEVEIVTWEDALDATPTQEANSGHDKGSILVQAGLRAKAPRNQDDPTPTREGAEAQAVEATETPIPTATNTPTVTPTPTLTPTPTPAFMAVLGEDGRNLAVYEYDEGEYRDERWYSMTLGIIVAAIVIALGTVFNMVRFLARGVKESREQ